ncbi:MAG: hypothetical protein JO190_04195 [Candidatus Eremiobacteraeota bacterium]|nr:hypothetical protein [Candidatus Eremiobacteraeota bacterium]MBV8498603.1 hypothetical protein [Candidatus Eremiobacteraeota bacterium]
MYRTLPVRVAATAAAFAACAALAQATTFVPSQTFKAGTRIQCTLEEHLDSSKLAYGDKFKLLVVDTSHPALHGSYIVGWITDVRQPTGSDRARVGFFLTTIHLPNGQKKSISAYVVNKRVVQINPAAQYQQRQRLSPMAGVPYGTVTPGPIAWQMRLGNGPSTVKQEQSGTLGGYVYGVSAHEPIVINAGTSVTVELAENLTIP